LVFSRILVPYDGSKQSDNALEKAVELANLIRSNDNKDIETILVQVVSEILMPTLFEALAGKPQDKIIQYAKNFKADLMIIGNVSQGNRISRTTKTLGSISGVVSEQAPCPVMIVH
jgi:nucleotide-binding universal stress UspA family protein